MKTKVFLILILNFILINLHAYAKPSLVSMTRVAVDSTGNLISPDTYYYFKALKYYNRGDKKMALQQFKFSAEFGGKRSMKYIALMYLDGDGIPQDLVKGQAWLKLSVNRGYRANSELLNKFKAESSDTEKKLVNQEYENLIQDYGSSVVLNNVYKYSRRFRFHTLQRPNTIKFQGKNVELSELRMYRLVDQIKDFYIETEQDMGEVIQGEIITKED